MTGKNSDLGDQQQNLSDSDADTQFHLDFLDKLDQELEANPLNEKQRSEARALEDRARIREKGFKKLDSMDSQTKTDPRMIPLKKSIQKASLDLRFLKPNNNYSTQMSPTKKKATTGRIQKMRKEQQKMKTIAGINKLKISQEFSKFSNDDVSLYTQDQTQNIHDRTKYTNNDETNDFMMDNTESQLQFKYLGLAAPQLNRLNMNYKDTFYQQSQTFETNQINQPLIDNSQHNDQLRNLRFTKMPNHSENPGQYFENKSGKNEINIIHNIQQNYFLQLHPTGSQQITAASLSDMRKQTDINSTRARFMSDVCQDAQSVKADPYILQNENQVSGK